MRATIITIFYFISLSLISCTQPIGVYKVKVQQGNVINSDMVNRLKIGMNSDCVREIMGSPLLEDTFNNNHWDYVYTLRSTKGDFVEKQLTLYFKNNRLIRIVKK